MPIRKWGAESIVTPPGTSLAPATNQKAFDVAALTDGGYVVVWTDDSVSPFALYAQIFSATGVPEGGPITVAPTLNAASKLEAVVTGLTDGGFVVQFTYDQNSGDQIVERFNASGISTALLTVDSNAEAETDPAIAATSLNGYVIAEQDGYSDNDIWFRRYSSSNLPGVFQAVTFTAGEQRMPTIAVDSLANVAVVWFDDVTSSYMLRTFNNANTPYTAAIVLRDISGTAEADHPPTVTYLGGNRFVVTYHLNEPDTHDPNTFAVMARIFTANGTLVGDEIPVNTQLVGIQARMDVSATNDGGFIVAFVDYSLGPRVVSIRAFDALGVATGPQVRVNTTGGTGDPEIATLDDGRVVVIWADGGSLRQQIVDPRDGVIFGDANANVIYGNGTTDDEINGLDGGDTLYGYSGNDTLYGGDGEDTLEGGRSDDTLYGGADNDLVKGGSGTDELYGEGGNDTLNSGGGGDSMYGGIDNDTYLANSDDFIFENAGEGTDTVIFYNGTSFALSATAEVETVQLSNAAGTASVNITGSNTGNTISGNNGNNVINGLGGIDALYGYSGNDTLNGGLGNDFLKGGAGSDRFRFDTALGATNVDGINDFSVVDDTIELENAIFTGLTAGANILATQFVIGAAATTAAHRLIYNSATGTLSFDADGNAGGAAVQFATVSTGLALTNADFFIT